jgi:hypothetical protein
MEETNSFYCSNTSNGLYSSFLIFLLACSSFALGYFKNPRAQRTLVVRILPVLNGQSPNQIKIFKIKKGASHTGMYPSLNIDEGTLETEAYHCRDWLFILTLLILLAILVLAVYNFNPKLLDHIKHGLGLNVTSDSEPPPSPTEIVPNTHEDEQNFVPDSEPPDDPEPEDGKKSWIGSEFLYWLLHPIKVQTRFHIRLL